MYVSVKGGERAIEAAHKLLDKTRRGAPEVPEITAAQIDQQLALAVDRVMCEGSLYDRRLAAQAIKQARGDLIEAIFLLRAYRTTLPRFGASSPIETGTMALRRRISATFKDLPGGQLLGPTFDYTHRLLDLDEEGAAVEATDPGPVAGPVPGLAPTAEQETPAEPTPRVVDILAQDGLIEPAGEGAGPVADLTRSPLAFPAGRDLRLQSLARGDEGFLLALGYSTQRGYARTHPFAGEIRVGFVEVEVFMEDLGFSVVVGEIEVTEVQMVNQFLGSAEQPPQFTRGYGLTFGYCERKGMSMALVDRSLRWRELGEDDKGVPSQDEEFVLSHADNVQATGFVEHLKLPHYVDFQSELELLRRLRAEVGNEAVAQEAAE